MLMIRTEEQARQLRCCGAYACGEERYLDGYRRPNKPIKDWSEEEGTAYGRSRVGRFCIASDCMAWMWSDEAHWDRTDGRTPEEVGAKTIQHGYCGLVTMTHREGG